MGSIVAMTTYPVRTRRWTRKEYERLLELEIVRDDEPLELIGGQLIVAEPKGSAHATAVELTAQAVRVAFGPGWAVRAQNPIALDDESEPEPDVLVVPGALRDYRDAHPSSAALVVEVSETSLAFDRRHKGSLYARAGVADYWIVNLVDRRLEVYRRPIADASAEFAWRYAEATTLPLDASVSPLARPDVAVLVSSLFP
jgi:Uma2 family endonuclease